MNSRWQRYLAKADECERLACAAKDQQAKQAFAECARQWRELAERFRQPEQECNGE